MPTAIRSTTATDIPLVFIGEMSVLKHSATLTDRPLRLFHFVSTTSETIDEARERVRLTDVTRCRALAARFAEVALEHPNVVDVRITRVEPELVVTAVTKTRDMELDLQLQRSFIEASREVEPDLRWSLRTQVEGAADTDGESLAD